VEASQPAAFSIGSHCKGEVDEEKRDMLILYTAEEVGEWVNRLELKRKTETSQIWRVIMLMFLRKSIDAWMSYCGFLTSRNEVLLYGANMIVDRIGRSLALSEWC
jgi:hypothetical protein